MYVILCDPNILCKVFMCKENSSGEILALKVLKKKVIIAEDDVESVLSENRILRMSSHPFLTVNLW